MKSERRHELKTNALARGLGSPETLRRHGSKVLLAVIVILLIIVWVRQRRSSTAERTIQIAAALTEARQLIDNLKELGNFAASPQDMATNRQAWTVRVESLLEQVAESDDPAVRAEGLVARGDLYWALANIPELPGAATQPLLRAERPAEEYLAQAEQAYQNVVASPEEAPRSSVVTARLGLAAVAENRGDWDGATRQYQALIDDAATPQPMKDLAEARLRILPQLRRPIRLAEARKVTPSTNSLEGFLPEGSSAPSTRVSASTTAPSSPATAPSMQP